MEPAQQHDGDNKPCGAPPTILCNSPESRDHPPARVGLAYTLLGLTPSSPPPDRAELILPPARADYDPRRPSAARRSGAHYPAGCRRSVWRLAAVTAAPAGPEPNPGSPNAVVSPAMCGPRISLTGTKARPCSSGEGTR